MKTNYSSFFTKSTFLVSVLFLGLTACQKQNEEIEPQTSDVTGIALVETAPEEIMATDAVGATSATASVSYTVLPATNVWTACSSGDLNNTSCGVTFKAGLRAYVKAVSGNKVTVQIQRCDGKPFGAGGTGYIKPTNPCGGTNNSIAGNTSWTSTTYNYIDVDFWATFTLGAVAFYPTITLTNGTRMYANPITVTAKDNIYFNKQLVTGANYSHYYQKDSPYYGGYACIPTSYMIAKRIVYPNAKFSTDELVRISKGMNLQSWGTSLANASSFAKTDIGSCNQSVQASTNTDWAITFLKDAMAAGKPVLAVTSLYGGHIVPVVGLKLSNIASESTVYYIDPIIKQAGVKEMNLSDFLAKVRAGSNSGSNYNFLRIGC